MRFRAEKTAAVELIDTFSLPYNLPSGVFPDLPDDIPEWRLKQEARALAIGLKLPPYRTRRQFELACAKCEAEAEDIEPGYDIDLALDDIREELEHSRIYGVLAYGRRWRVSQGQASRMITELENRGFIKSERIGRERRIVWARPYAFEIVEAA